jgi:hypothetical protein
MATDRKMTMAKRAREMAQKDRSKDRESRRADRRARSAERAASGQVGPPIEALQPGEGGVSPDDDAPAPVTDTNTTGAPTSGAPTATTRTRNG